MIITIKIIIIIVKIIQLMTGVIIYCVFEGGRPRCKYTGGRWTSIRYRDGNEVQGVPVSAFTHLHTLLLLNVKLDEHENRKKNKKIITIIIIIIPFC